MLTVVPDLIQPLVAYRMWGYSIDGRGLRLGTTNVHGDAWLGAERRDWVTASCGIPWVQAHTVPSECCTCGFYSVKAVEDAEEILFTVRSVHRGVWIDTGCRPGELPPLGSVFGQVELAGKVIEHRLGYRAERARVLELIPLGEDDGTTGAVAQLLGVPAADALDVSRVDREIDRFENERPALAVGRLRPPTLIERLRLMSHRRHLRLLLGGAAAGSEPNPPLEGS